MGFAHGELMKQKALNMMNDVWAYLEEQVVSITSDLIKIQLYLFFAGGGNQWNN